MIRYVGLDVHRRDVVVHISDPAGKRLAEMSVACTKSALEEFAREHLTAEDQVVLESTGACWPVLRIIEPFVGKVTAANSLLVRSIAEAKVKTDRIDARVLANLLRCGYLPEVWTPDSDTQRLRALTHRRTMLVAERTRCKNRIRAALANELLPRFDGDLFDAHGLAYLQNCPLSQLARAMVESDLRLLDATAKELDTLDKTLVTEAYQNEMVRLLMTLPGVDYETALTVYAALGDIRRFRDGDHAAAYLGIAPATRQSGPHCYHGPITKRGNSKARWMLIQAVQRMDINPGPLGVFFRRLARRKNRNVAAVATARKLVVIAWHMLKNNEPYRYALPAPTRAKLISLRTKATGQRRTTGSTKGKPRTKRYGTGLSERHTPGLPDVYAAEALPHATAPCELPEGEQRHLEDTGTREFAERIQTQQSKIVKTPPRRNKVATAASEPEAATTR
jgi:transposase